MKKRDRKNLKFLLSLDSQGLKQWYDQATEDDLDYASELLAMAKQQQQRQQAKQQRQVSPMALFYEAPRTLQ